MQIHIIKPSDMFHLFLTHNPQRIFENHVRNCVGSEYPTLCSIFLFPMQ